jgi:hypothetical protein
MRRLLSQGGGSLIRYRDAETLLAAKKAESNKSRVFRPGHAAGQPVVQESRWTREMELELRPIFVNV